MARVGRLGVMMLLSAVLLITGCTGLWRSQTPTGLGQITGRVTDEAGNALVGIRILMDTGEDATTDETGRFHISGVPVGTRRLSINYFTGTAEMSVTTAHHVALDAGGVPFRVDELNIPWEDIMQASPAPKAAPAVHVETLQVTAGPNHIDVQVPNYRNVDALYMYQALPAAGEPLLAGSRIDMQYSFTYSLASDAEGAVGILVYYETPNGKTENIAQPPVQYVKGGTGKVVITTNGITIPPAANVQVYAALITPDGTVATQSMAPYPVQAGDVPIVPELQLIGYDDFRVLFHIGTQRPEGFKAYRLMRNTGQSPTVSQEVQTVTDTTTELMFDIPPAETTYYYWLELLTDPPRQPRMFSNRVQVPITRHGVYELPLTANQVPAALIADPMRDLVYAAVPLYNKVQVISTVVPPGVHGIQRDIPVGARPDQMAITASGRWLFVTSPGNHSLTQIDLNTYATTHWPGLQHIGGIAVHPDDDKLYVGINEAGNTRVQLYDIATRTLLREESAATVSVLAVDRDGTYLYAGHNLSATVDVFAAATLTPVASLPNIRLGYRIMPSHGDATLIGHHTVDTTNWTAVVQPLFLPVALSDDESFLFVLGHTMADQNHHWEQNALYIFERGLATPTMRIVMRMREPEAAGAAFALSRDGKRLYVIERPTSMVYIDLEERRNFGTL